MTVYYAVVGASRGIGLEFVRQLASRPDSVVFALVRNKQKSTHLASAVSALNNVHVFDADVADHESLTHAAQDVAKVSGGKLDYLIHNAAKTDTSVLRGYDDFETMDELNAEFIESFRVNALGVVHSTAAFLPLLRAAPTKRIVVIGSGGGDHKFVYDAGIASMGAYGASKGAAVVLAAKWAVKLKDEGFVVVTLSPGLVDTTDPSNAEARDAIYKSEEALRANGFKQGFQTPEQSVRAQLQVIDGLTPADNGAFLKHNGDSYI